MADRLRTPEFDSALAGLLQNEAFDVVQVEGIELAASIRLVRRLCAAGKVVYDAHNAEAKLQRLAFRTDLGEPRRWPAAVYSLVQAGRLRRFERWACLSADVITAVSEADAASLRRLAPGRPVTVIPNSIDLEQYQAPPPESVPPFDLVFVGKMDYRPNVDAALWFAGEIWPLVRRARPLVTWAIVGQKPHPRLEPLRALPGVTITGRVEQVMPYVAGARVAIMPLRLGSGTRLKLLEAMAAAKAIVSTSAGAAGYPVQSGRELILADEPAAFAEAILRLLDDHTLASRLGIAGRELAARYDWRRVVPAFDALYEQLLTEQ
jgi:glycosyltransferase involved in cell wall biosynthesis